MQSMYVLHGYVPRHWKPREKDWFGEWLANSLNPLIDVLFLPSNASSNAQGRRQAGREAGLMMVSDNMGGLLPTGTDDDGRFARTRNDGTYWELLD